MANTAFELGWKTRQEEHDAKRLRKEALEDEARQSKVKDLWEQRTAIRQNLSKLGAPQQGDAFQVWAKANPDQATDYQQGISAMQSIQTQLDDIHDPIKNPGALQRDFEFIKKLITRRQPAPAARTAAPPAPTATTPPAATATASLTVPAAATQPGPAATATPTPGAPLTLPGGVSKVTGPAVPAAYQTPQQRQQQARQQRAQQEAQQFMLAGPLSPEQQAQGESALAMATVTQAMKDFKTLRPEATKEEQSGFFSEVVAKAYGLTAQEKPVWKEYQLPSGKKEYYNVAHPESIPPDATAVGTESADVRKRADYDAFKKQHPEYKGTFEQWGVEQAQQGRLAVPAQRDDRYIAIEQKKALGQPLTTDEQAYAAAYDLYISKRIIAPGVARAAAFAGDRYMQVLDPSNPEKVVLMRAADAARAGVGTPQSIAFQTDKALAKYMIAGPGGQNIAYFSTATDHLKLLSQAADALNNDDLQLANKLGNALGVEFGDDAVTNFNAVRNAVAGELSKTFAGKGATVEEIAQINQTINAAMSPEQLHGAIDYYISLMGGRLDALRAQYATGMQGQPAFPENVPQGGGGPPPGAAGSKGSVSITEAMKKPKYAHMSKAQVSKAITDAGYTPTP